MAESDFSWLKIASFLGATLLVVVCFIMIAFGITQFMSGNGFYGAACLVSGLVCGACAVFVYKNYQKRN